MNKTSEKFPRLTADHLPEPLATELRAVAQRLGYLNDIFLQGHVPASISTFMAYTQAVKAPLSDRYNEVVALTACSALTAEAELIQHERLALRLGMSKDWIAAAQGRPGCNDAELIEPEQQIRRVVLDVIAGMGLGTEPALTALAQAIGPEQAMAVLLQTTRFMMIAVLYRAFQLTVPVPSIFEDASQ